MLYYTYFVTNYLFCIIVERSPARGLTTYVSHRREDNTNPNKPLQRRTRANKSTAMRGGGTRGGGTRGRGRGGSTRGRGRGGSTQSRKRARHTSGSESDADDECLVFCSMVIINKLVDYKYFDI